MNFIHAAQRGLTGIFCLLVLQGCAGNGNGLDANGRPIGESGGGSVPLSADFASLQTNIFTPICSVCHVGGAAPEGLRLDAANSYNLLVGVPSTEVSTLQRVTPADPDSSYLIQKLEGHAAVGERMPLGGPYLSDATIAFVRQWIANGAPPAGTVAASHASLAIKSIVPDESEPVSASPPQIAIEFNHELDVTQLGGLSAHIDLLDVETQTTLRVPARINVPTANSKMLLITPSRPLKPGRYRLYMDGTAGAVVRDSAGGVLYLGTASTGESLVSTFDVEVLP
jgi:methionine-rich copper-binding protein CopC